MLGYVEAPEAWWRVNGMARSLGVSLPRAVTDGVLTRKELVGLVQCCESCGQAGPCNDWLGDADHGPDLPKFCANSAQLTDLRDEG